MALRTLKRWLAVTMLLPGLLTLTNCFLAGSGPSAPPTQTAVQPGVTPTVAVPAAASSPATPQNLPVAASTSAPPQNLPVGFPVAVNTRPMRVVETSAGRDVAPPAANGPSVVDAAGTYQPRAENDDQANGFGWNCRLHEKYEGAPAVDWYLPAKTPVTATMRGQAELYVITTLNAFTHYGVNPRVTLGLPSPSMPLFPLPGPGGGMGVFVSILNGDLRAEYGHLDLPATLAHVPAQAFIAPYSRTFDYDTRFNKPLQPWDGTLVARWNVERGATVGAVGNSGYSDVAHLHYQVVTADRATKFCPTREDYPSAGWLFGQPKASP